jgi:hypothetical protein
VLTLSITVKKTIKNIKDKTITIGLYRLSLANDHHNITGITGKTHGANTLNIPAKKEIINRDIVIM